MADSDRPVPWNGVCSPGLGKLTLEPQGSRRIRAPWGSRTERSEREEWPYVSSFKCTGKLTVARELFWQVYSKIKFANFLSKNSWLSHRYGRVTEGQVSCHSPATTWLCVLSKSHRLSSLRSSARREKGVTFCPPRCPPFRTFWESSGRGCLYITLKGQHCQRIDVNKNMEEYRYWERKTLHIFLKAHDRITCSVCWHPSWRCCYRQGANKASCPLSQSLQLRGKRCTYRYKCSNRGIKGKTLISLRHGLLGLSFFASFVHVSSGHLMEFHKYYRIKGPWVFVSNLNDHCPGKAKHKLDQVRWKKFSLTAGTSAPAVAKVHCK